MPGGIISGLDTDTGLERPVKVTPQGELLTESPDDLGPLVTVLHQILLEIRAVRLATEELVNAGRADQVDFLELSEGLEAVEEEGF